MPGNDLTIIIPAYNEEESLADFLPRVIEYCTRRDWQVIVVDDGSTDRTRTIAESHQHPDRVKVIHHKLNRGYGGAVKTGIAAANTRFVITIDADGQHFLDDIEFLEIDRRTLPKGDYSDAGVEKRQIIDIDISRWVVEYQAEVLINTTTGTHYTASFPDGVSKAVQYGRKLKAHAVYLSQYQLLPDNRVQ